MTGTLKVFICVLNDKRIDKYFLMADNFIFQKVVFYWLKPVPRPAVCFVEFLYKRGKKAQNWGFEITNVRYGHQAAFCFHFNDGSNSCFQTTNWIATLHGNRHFGQHLCGLFLHLFSLIIIIADSCPTATLMKWDLKKFWGANFAKVAFHPTLELSTFKYWEIKSGSEEQKLS